jgi:LacI family transcriptional regulator
MSQGPTGRGSLVDGTATAHGVRATLADVARLAGVSKGTASKALNNKQHVHPDTVRRVAEAAARLDLMPSAVARNLTAGRTGTVGILTNDLEGRFALPILAGAEDALGAGRLSVILCDAREDAIRERRHLATLMERRIDGLIVVGGARTDPRPSLGHDLAVPVVYAYAPSEDPDDLSLVTDNVAAGRVAAEHLWEVGCRTIAYIGGDPTYIASAEREQGAREALAERGAELLVEASVLADWTELWGRQAAARILEKHPGVDGVIGASDGLARATLDILRDHGRAVPGDVAVIGFDNWAIIATNTRPQLSSVDLQLQALGRIAASRLFSALAGEELGQGVEALPVRLVTRASTQREP